MVSAVTVRAHRRPALWWLIAAIACLLALGSESLVVQTHVHFEGRAPGYAAPDTVSLPTSDPLRGPIPCALCREAAQSGHDLLAPPLFTFAAVVVQTPAAVALPLTLRWSQRPHDHRSRGPPASPHA